MQQRVCQALGSGMRLACLDIEAMRMRQVVPTWLGLLAVVGCATDHNGTADQAGTAGKLASDHARASGSDAAGEHQCSVKTDAPRTFPEGGPCDDEAPVRGELTFTPAGHYIVTCEPQPLEAPGCRGVPNDAWNKCALRRCAPSVSYPKGCHVVMPTGNPHFSNNADTCECQDPFVPGNFLWMCPI